MKLEPVGLRGRRFTIQFYEVMNEFGKVIPWLAGMDELKFATNGEYFRDELMSRTSQRDGLITPYQFVDTDAPGTFLGGILHFPTSPEHLIDRRNNEAVERLTAEGASFVSCLQVREGKRGAGIGHAMMQRAIRAIHRQHGSVWGVVSDARLIPWYVSIGAELLSPMENRDRLWIIIFRR